MRIEQVHIEQFGALIDRHIDALGPGMTVLYGPNEAGKTSLLEFIRRTLFGYPSRRSSALRYDAINGKPSAGALQLRLHNNATCSVIRADSGKSEPEIEYNGNMVRGDGALQDLIGNIPESLFSKVYAIGLQELHEIDALQLEGLKGALFGAGAGVGDPIKIKDTFDKVKAEIFQKTARKRLLHTEAIKLQGIERQLAEARAQISEYDTLVRDLRQERESVVSLRTDLRQAQDHIRRLQILDSIYPEFVSMCSMRRELGALGEYRELPGSLLDEVERYREAKKGRKTVLASIEEDIISLRAKFDIIIIDEALIHGAGRIEALKSQRESYENAVIDLPRVRADRERLSNRILDEIKSINKEWSQTDISGFSLSVIDRQELSEYSERFRTMRVRLQLAETKAEQLRLDAAVKARPVAIKQWPLIAVALVAIVGIVFGLWQSNWWLSGFAALILGIAGILLLSLRRVSADGQRDTLGDEVWAIQSEYDTLREQWRAVVERIGLDPSLEPDSVGECLSTIKSLQERIHQLTEYDSRIAMMEEKIASVDAEYSSLISEIDTNTRIPQFLSGIVAFDERLKAQIKELNNRENYERQLAEAETKKKLLSMQDAQEAESLQALLQEYGIADLDAFTERHNQWIRAVKLEASIADEKRQIERAVGIGGQFDAAIEFLGNTTPDMIAQNIESIQAKIDSLDERINAGSRRIVELESQIAGMQSREDISAMMLARECGIEQFNRLVRKYIVAHTAGFVLDRAVSYYEENRQPAVIRRAGQLFSQLTCGKYVRLIRSMENNQIAIVGENGRNKTEKILSRGTKEQLYLAYRLAAIEEFERHSEPMPFIIDDILVNFDDERRAATSEVLIEFAKDRQVLVLTCHEETRDRFEKLGATWVVLSS